MKAIKDFISKYWLKIIKLVWWLLLLVLGVIYICVNYSAISTNPNIVDGIVLFSVAIFIFMPLVSEVTILGMSIKKELKEATNELKYQISNIKLDLIHNNSNSQRSEIKIGFGDSYLPSRDDIKKDIDHLKPKSTIKEAHSLKDNGVYSEVSDEQIMLFKARYTIERKLVALADKLNFDTPFNYHKISTVLCKNELIDKATVDYIKNIYSICNRGIHGEIVDAQYLDYVSKMLPLIIEKLDSAANKVDHYTYCICTRCGYKGLSKFSNSCPSCGYVSDDV